MQARGRWVLRDRPGVVWLAAAILVALGHRALADSRWIMVHLVMLGAITHSITVWSAHFTTTWLKSDHPQLARDAQNKRLMLLNGGAAVVIATVPLPWHWAWWLTVVGATAVALAVGWHAAAIAAALRSSLTRRWKVSIAHYVLASTFLLGGIVLGVMLAQRPADPLHGQLLVAHTVLNVLGWVGCSVLGTLVTLWPTMLRTKMPDASLKRSGLTLGALALGITTTAMDALVNVPRMSVVGLLVVLVAIALTWATMLKAARTSQHLRGFGVWSVIAGQVWLAASVVSLAVALATQTSWGMTGSAYGRQTTMFVAGFALQTLLGAMSHLVPAVLGGGPRIVKATVPYFDRWHTARLVLTNVGLLVCVAINVTWVRAAVSVLVLLGLASFVPLMLKAIRAAVAVRREMVAARTAGTVPLQRTEEDESSPKRTESPAIQALSAIVALMLAVAAGVAIDPIAAGFGAAPQAAVTPTGQTTTVEVTAANMRFTPSTITVPKGNRLVIKLRNTDAKEAHDLVLATGVTSGRLAPGATKTIDAGVIGSSMDGWCSIVGHRQMGMTLTINVKGEPAASSGAHSGHDMSAMAGGGSTAGETGLDMMKRWPASVTPASPALPALTSDTVHKVTLTVTEKLVEVAPGVKQKRWMSNNTAPGPTLHGRVGDTFEVTLVNEGSMGHSIDFHAGELAPDQPMRTIKPGEKLTYRFTAKRAGVWMYHCSTMPMSTHIAAGMAGAVVIEPDGLQPLPSYLLVQSELYLGANGSAVNTDKVAAQTPDAVVFNGRVRQYDDHPIDVPVGKKVRVWVLNVGPNRPSSFHVVGSQFSTVYAEGAYLLQDGKDAFGHSGNGSQALALQPAQGGFVELQLLEAGHYPFVSHIMSDADKGAHGVLRAKK